MNRASVWPHPYLTEQEAKGVALYRTPLPDGTVLPGLLRRVYPFQLIQTTVTGEQSVLSVRYITSGLRSLVFGMSFSGDVEFWKISLRTASGVQVFDTSPVAALINLPFVDGCSQAQDSLVPADSLQRPNGPPLIWDPPILLDGTQALQIDGSPLTSAYTSGEGGGARGVLNFAFHVWEIPSQGSRGPVPPTPTSPPRSPVPALRAVPTPRARRV